MALVEIPMRGQAFACGHEHGGGQLSWLTCDAPDCEMTGPIAGTPETATQWAINQGWAVTDTCTLCPNEEPAS